jgi:hypothetical protein
MEGKIKGEIQVTRRRKKLLEDLNPSAWSDEIARVA